MRILIAWQKSGVLEEIWSPVLQFFGLFLKAVQVIERWLAEVQVGGGWEIKKNTHSPVIARQDICSFVVMNPLWIYDRWIRIRIANAGGIIEGILDDILMKLKYVQKLVKYRYLILLIACIVICCMEQAEEEDVRDWCDDAVCWIHVEQYGKTTLLNIYIIITYIVSD